jgi:hypothetical protein
MMEWSRANVAPVQSLHITRRGSMNVLDTPAIRRLRQNHALEHATVHLLVRRAPVRLVGRSDLGGFWLYGNVDTRHVAEAATEALSRLGGGEVNLAVHPRCGTNLAVAAMLSGVAAMGAASMPISSRAVRLGAFFLAMAGITSVAGPMGLMTQRHVTTIADVSDLTITAVRRRIMGRVMVHRVVIEHADDARPEEYVIPFPR